MISVQSGQGMAVAVTAMVAVAARMVVDGGVGARWWWWRRRQPRW